MLALIAREGFKGADLLFVAEGILGDLLFIGTGVLHGQRGGQVKELDREHRERRRRQGDDETDHEPEKIALKHKAAHIADIRESRRDRRNRRDRRRCLLGVARLHPAVDKDIADSQRQSEQSAEHHRDIAVADKAEHAEHDHDQQRGDRHAEQRDQNARQYHADKVRRARRLSESESDTDGVEQHHAQHQRELQRHRQLRNDDLPRRKGHGQQHGKVIRRVQHRDDVLDGQHKAHQKNDQHQGPGQTFQVNKGSDKRFDQIGDQREERDQKHHADHGKYLCRGRRDQSVLAADRRLAVAFLQNGDQLPDLLEAP